MTSRNWPAGAVCRRASRAAVAQRSQDQPPRPEPGLLADASDLLDRRRRTAPWPTRVRGPPPPSSIGMKSSSQSLVHLAELPHGLEPDHLGQLFVGRGRKLELAELDARPSDRHQRVGLRDAVGRQRSGDLLADFLRRGLGRGGVQQDRKRLLDHRVPCSSAGHRDAGLAAGPFESNKLRHGGLELRGFRFCKTVVWVERSEPRQRPLRCLRIGEGISGGLSQFSFDENGTVPFGLATVIVSPILTRLTPLPTRPSGSRCQGGSHLSRITCRRGVW